MFKKLYKQQEKDNVIISPKVKKKNNKDKFLQEKNIFIVLAAV